ncbi:MAG: hypothetical protein GEU83_16775 [Pseudonocardiaceae bacterium]|nr:hypothetical protein [Pseudonocardiaceae bacterium]
MTVPDPEEQDRRADAARSGPGGNEPARTDAAFDEIVAGWRAEPDAPRWPSDADSDAADRNSAGSADPAPRSGNRGRVPAEQPAEEEHFEPPEPPPMPTLRPRTVGGLLLIALGSLLLFAPGLAVVSERIGTPLGLLTLAGGIGWLVLGLRSGPPADSGWDDGAQL